MVSTKNGGRHCGYSRLGQEVGAGRTFTINAWVLARIAARGKAAA